MPLVLTRNPALLSLQPMAQEAEANDPPVITTYSPAVESWRRQAWDMMPPQLRARPDAAVLLDKALYTNDGESSGREDAVGDGGAAWGGWQSHHIPAGSSRATQIADMWRMVANNPEQWTDWGEGSTYQGQPFGALGRSPYGGGGTVTQGGMFGEKVSDGGRAQSWFAQARDNALRLAEDSPGISLDYSSDVGPRPLPQQITPPDTGNAGLMVAPSIANPGDTGDVPYAAGQGMPGTYQENAGAAGNAQAPTADEVMQQAGIGGGGVLPNLRDAGNAALGTIPGVGAYQAKDALTQPFGGVVKQAGSLLEEGGKLGGRALALQQALSSGGYAAAPGQERMGRYNPGPAEAVGGYAGSTIVPQTPLDAVLTAGPEVLPAARAIRAGAPVLPTIARGAVGALVPGLAGLNDDAAKAGEAGARGVAANIIGDADAVRKKAAKAAEMLATLRQAGHTDAEIEAALPGAIALAEGGTASQRAAQTLPNLTGEAQSRAAKTTYETVLKDTGSVEMATAEARKAAAVEQDATKGLRGRAGALSERMAGGVAAEGGNAPPKVLYHGATKPLEGGAPRPGTYGAEGWELAQSHAVYDIKRTRSETPQITRIEVLDPKAIKPAGRPGEWQVVDPKGVKVIDSTPIGVKFPEGGWGFQEKPPESWGAAAAKAGAQTPPGAAGIVGDAGAGAAASGERTLAHEADALDAAYGASQPGSGGLLRVARDLGDPVSAARDIYKRSGQNQAVEGEGGKRRTPEENAALRAARTAGPADIRGAAQAERAARAAEPAAKRAEAQAAKAAAEQERLAEIDRLRRENAPAVQANRGAIEEGLQMAGTKAPEDIADTATKGGNVFTDAAQAERAAARAEPAARRAGQQATRQTAAEASMAERDAWIERNRAAVAANRSEIDTALPQAHEAAVRTLQYAERQQAARTAARAAQGAKGIGSEIAAAAGVPRALALSVDLGTLRDLSILGSSRKGFGPATRGAVAGGKAYLSPAKAEELQNGVKALTHYEDLVKGGEEGFARPAHFYEYGSGGAPELRNPEMSGIAENTKVGELVSNLPHVLASDRALAVQRNVAGFELLDRRWDELAMKYGTTDPRFWSEMQSTIDSVNHLRGYSGGSKAKALGALNFLLSPQQMISRLQLIGDPINFALRGDMESAKFAGENLLTFAASQTALLTALKLAGRQTGGWSVDANPLDGDFGQVQVGNTRFDTLAGLGPIVKTVARIGATVSDAAFDTDFAKNHSSVKDLVEQWIANKQNPTAKIFYDMAKTMKLPSVSALAGLVAPSIAMGIMESIRENRGANKLLAVPGAVGNMFGVGVNTYATGEDTANEISKESFGGKPYSQLALPEKLQVLAKLPEDALKAQDNPKTQAKQAFEAARESAGYQGAPKDADGKPIKELPEVTTNRNKANSEVYRKNPELDVQRWFFSDSPTDPEGGPLKSPAAVSQALALNMPEQREVRFQPKDGITADRNLNTEQGRKLWQAEQQRVTDFYDPKTIAAYKEVADYYAQNRYGKPYAQLAGQERSNIETSTRTAYREDHPDLDALMAYMGFGGSSETKRYLVHSLAAQAPLEALRAKYGRDAARKDEGWGFATAANAR